MLCSACLHPSTWRQGSFPAPPHWEQVLSLVWKLVLHRVMQVLSMPLDTFSYALSRVLTCSTTSPRSSSHNHPDPKNPGNLGWNWLSENARMPLPLQHLLPSFLKCWESLGSSWVNHFMREDTPVRKDHSHIHTCLKVGPWIQNRPLPPPGGPTWFNLWEVEHFEGGA